MRVLQLMENKDGIYILILLYKDVKDVRAMALNLKNTNYINEYMLPVLSFYIQRTSKMYEICEIVIWYGIWYMHQIITIQFVIHFTVSHFPDQKLKLYIVGCKTVVRQCIENCYVLLKDDLL